MKAPCCVFPIGAALAVAVCFALGTTAMLATSETVTPAHACTRAATPAPAPLPREDRASQPTLSEATMLLLPIGVLACAGLIIGARLQQKDSEDESAPSQL